MYRYLICECVLAAALVAAPAVAADYPVRPVRILVGAVPGGGVDITARVLAPRLSDQMKQQFIVENRPGGSGNIALELVAKSPPDSYTLMMATIGTLAINPALFSNLPFDVLRDLAPVSRSADSTNILVVHPALPARNVKELIALGKSRPGQLLYGSPQSGTTGHLAAEMFSSMAGIKMVHIPYKGGTPAMIDLISGQLQLYFATAATSVQQIRAGKIRALAVTTAKRAAIMPELPTIAESGLPGFETNNWYGVVAPARTPDAVIRVLNREINTALCSPAVRDALLAQGMDPAPGTPEEFAAYIKSETAKWGKVVKASGARAD